MSLELETLQNKKPSGDLYAPASAAFTVTPSDSADMPRNSRGIICNDDGTVRCTFINNVDDSYVDITVKGGVLYPFRIKRIWATTTDVDVVAVL